MDSTSNHAPFASNHGVKSPTILVADDDVVALEGLSELLSLSGFKVVMAHSGEEAWRIFSERTPPPNLVITDILMPGLDGMGLLKSIREADEIIPVIIITGFGEMDSAISALRLGAYDFLLKPINSEILVSTVQKGLEHYRLKLLEREYTHRLEMQVDSRTKELAEANEFLRGILESSRGVSIVVTDLNKKVLFWNSGAKNIFGYDDEEMIGQSIVRLYPPCADEDTIQNSLKEALESKSKSAQKIIKQISKTNQEITLSLAISPMLDRKGRLQAAVGLGQDVTEQYRLHQELLQSYARIRKIQGASIFALAKLAEVRDGETGGHLKRIRDYCAILCKTLRTRAKYGHILTDEFVEDLVQCSVLHDIGKIVISDEILFKPGKYGSEEMEVMRQHALLGGKALFEASIETGESQSYLSVGAEVAYYHHEHWDGAGYPFGLREHEIPISARIVALCDVYDALRSKRRYKDDLSHEESRRIIVNERGKHFDPEIVDAFLECEAEFRLVRDQTHLSH